jgi:hypothetical protein
MLGTNAATDSRVTHTNKYHIFADNFDATNQLHHISFPWKKKYTKDFPPQKVKLPKRGS